MIPRSTKGEEPVAVGYGVAGARETWWQDKEEEIAWVPEPIFARAQAIAGAYHLRLMPSINIYARTELDKSQARTLLAEIGFIAKVIHDPLLSTWLGKMENIVLKVVKPEENLVVIIEGP